MFSFLRFLCTPVRTPFIWYTRFSVVVPVGVRFWIMSNVRRNCVPIMDLSGGMMRKGGTTAIGDDVDGGRVMHTSYRKI